MKEQPTVVRNLGRKPLLYTFHVGSLVKDRVTPVGGYRFREEGIIIFGTKSRSLYISDVKSRGQRRSTPVHRYKTGYSTLVFSGHRRRSVEEIFCRPRTGKVSKEEVGKRRTTGLKTVSPTGSKRWYLPSIVGPLPSRNSALLTPSNFWSTLCRRCVVETWRGGTETVISSFEVKELDDTKL